MWVFPNLKFPRYEYIEINWNVVLIQNHIFIYLCIHLIFMCLDKIYMCFLYVYHSIDIYTHNYNIKMIFPFFLLK